MIYINSSQDDFRILYFIPLNVTKSVVELKKVDCREICTVVLLAVGYSHVVAREAFLVTAAVCMYLLRARK